MNKSFLIFGLAVLSGPGFAEPPQITDVQVDQSDGSARFSVTLAHPDTGWDHYADGWRVEDATGKILGTRVLHHPHVEEQPFTRSLGGVAIPDGATVLYIRAKCSVDGWAEDTVTVDILR